MKYIKTTFTILALGLSILRLNAMCALDGIYVFPTGNTIMQNSIFVVDGYASSQNTIENLNKEFPVFLISGKERINLNVKEIRIGEYGLTQAVLIPERYPTVGLTYTLIIDNLEEYESVERWNSRRQKREPCSFTIKEGRDQMQPILISEPQAIESIYNQHSCGPEVFVEFECRVRERSEYLVKATVKSLTSGKETVYYVQPEGHKVKIGHDMCSGAFSFNDGDSYEISISIMDASGNLTVSSNDPITFNKPSSK